MSNCTDWKILESKKIPYGHPPRGFFGFCRKVLNTVLSSLAYSCPSNGLRVLFHRWRGCHIGKGVYIGRYCLLDNMYPEYIYIYDGASINAETMILTHFNPFEVWKKVFPAEVKPVVIGQDAIVAVRCTIMPGVTIGKNAVVSSGCILEHSVADYNMVQTTVKYKTIDLKVLV